VSGPAAIRNPTVYACTTLIAQSIAKMRLRLVELTAEGVWVETASPAFSPVLRRPNRYQLMNGFVEYWMTSKLQWGNTYALKQRDARGVVVGLDILNPSQVTVLEAPDGAIYYQLRMNALAGVPPEGVTVPASEIIHDKLTPLWHPLIGVSPIYACALAATQGTQIQDSSTLFFGNRSTPGGIIMFPGELTAEAAQKKKTEWETNFGGVNAGRIGVLTAGAKFEPTAVNAVDAQLIEQLKWTEQVICGCYKVPMSLINSAPVPYANNEPLTQQFYSQCLQAHSVALELALDDGLGLTSVPGVTYGTEFDIDDLLWMDTATRTKAATDAVSGGVLSPNEARFKYFGLGSVPGGASPMAQQQMFSLEALAERDSLKPFAAPPAPPAPPAPAEDDDDDLEAFALAGLLVKALDEGALHG
jgi:HK97 family phage portal protein